MNMETSKLNLAERYKNRYRNKCDKSTVYFIYKHYSIYEKVYSLYLAFHCHYKYGKKIPKIFFRLSINDRNFLRLRIF